MTLEIGDFPQAHANGLGITFQNAVWDMMRHPGRDYYVNIDKENSPYRSREHGLNPWDYYFDQPAPVGPVERVIPESPLDLPLSGHRDWTLSRSRAASAFARQHIRLKPDIQTEVDVFKAQHFKGKVLGLSIRGTDKIEEYKPARDREVMADIAAIKERLKPDTIFLMTDDVRYHRTITNLFGAVSIKIPRTDRSLHHNPPRGPYLSGRWAVVDGFLAASCSWFYYTPSNFATIALCMGHFDEIGRIKSGCVIEPFCQRVDRVLGLIP